MSDARVQQVEFPSLIPLFDQLTGERIIVRPHRLNDAEPLWDVLQESRDQLRPWLPFADQSYEQLRNWLSKSIATWQTREAMNCAIEDRETSRLLGNIGLIVLGWDIRSFEIGYWQRTSATGHGYVAEAVRLVTDFAFDHLDANRVMIRCDAENIRSAAVAKRLGFPFEGRMRQVFAAPDGHLADLLVFAMVRSDPRWPTRP